MDGVIHMQDDSVLCETCTKCEDDCASSPDSKVHDCPDYEQKLASIKIPSADEQGYICRGCMHKDQGCIPDTGYSCMHWECDPKMISDSKGVDPVNHPSHYTQGGIECIDCIRASMSKDGFEDYCKGNVIKYLHRWRFKGGVQDLRKAEVYLMWLIQSAEKGIEDGSKG